MSTYYCHECAIRLGLLQPINPETNLTGSNYTLNKYIKHTVPPTGSHNGGEIISTFDSTEFDSYKNYVVNTAASGSVEIDDQKRTNLIWCAGEEIGFTFLNGKLQGPVQGVKVVFHTDSSKIHAFPTASQDFGSHNCANCNKLIIS